MHFQPALRPQELAIAGIHLRAYGIRPIVEQDFYGVAGEIAVQSVLDYVPVRQYQIWADQKAGSAIHSTVDRGVSNSANASR